MYLLKGKVLEALNNRVLALECYLAALGTSVYCVEALDALIQNEMMLPYEERALMKYFPFALQCSEPDERVVRKMFETKLKKYYDSQAAVSVSVRVSDFNLIDANFRENCKR